MANNAPVEPFAPHDARTVARLARQVEVALATVELTQPQYRILALLSEGSAAATALARRLAVSRPSVTALVDGLVARGYVARGSDPQDRRRVTHVLTPQGRRILARADDAATERLAEIARHVAPPQVAAARAGLAGWREALDAYRETKVAGL